MTEESFDTNSYPETESGITCYLAGTLIETDTGLVPIEAIRPGDQVLTLDGGHQKVLWAGGQHYPASAVNRNRTLRPITIEPDAFGPGCPKRRLIVSPQHRFLCCGAAVELHFGTDEVLASAKALVNGSGICDDWKGLSISYHHILFACHQVIRAEGLWAESLFTGDLALSAMTAEARRQIDQALGENLLTQKTARMCLTPNEAAVLAPTYTVHQIKRPNRIAVAA